MRMFSTRANLNRCAVTEAFIDDIIANKDDYVCMPLCADVSKLKNKDYRGLTHLYDKTRGVFLADEIGGFYDFEKVNDEYGVSLIGYARINKRSDLVCEAIQELYDQGKLNFSFEISAGAVSIIDGITIVDANEDNELTAMAVVSIPAYPESTALDLVAEAQQSIEQFYENAQVLISEMDFETVRERFFKLLYMHHGGEHPYSPRVLLFCVDCVIFYEEITSKTFKVEYMVDNEEFIIKDVYEVKFERSEGSEEEMNVNPENVQEMEAAVEVTETVTEVESNSEAVVSEESVVEVAETVEVEAAEETEAADGTANVEDAHVEAEAACETAYAEVDHAEAEDAVVAELREEIANLKAELERMKSEREEAEKKVEREKMTEFAENHGLDIANTVVAEAIKNLDHKTLMSEMMANDNRPAKSETASAVRENCDIKPAGNSYLFERV